MSVKTLSIHDGHNSNICVYQNSKLVTLLSEERFTNVKNQGGFPQRALTHYLRSTNTNMDDFHSVVMPHENRLIDYGSGSSSSLSREAFALLSPIFGRKVLGSRTVYRAFSGLYSRAARIRQITIGFNGCGLEVPANLRIVEHHEAHAFAAVAFSGFYRKYEKFLIFTADTSGDGVSATVSIFSKKGGLTRLSSNSAYDSLCKLYSTVTEMMGMKPNEHEYKLMGMAPYVPDIYSEKVYNIFCDIVRFNHESGEFENVGCYGDRQIKNLTKVLFKCRFDAICAGLQRHFEECVATWVEWWINRTGVNIACFGGGGFMNVKSNMILTEKLAMDDYFFCPSSGDESTSIGAAFSIVSQAGVADIEIPKNIYLGRSFSFEAIENEIAPFLDQFDISRRSTVSDVADLLADGKIVARFDGAEEFGARALGHRSILCRTDSPATVTELNRAVKMRDFWMPFAASVLDHVAPDYFENYDKKSDMFMMKTYRVRPNFQNLLRSGIHPYDGTCRAQIVYLDDESTYYQLMCAYMTRTHCGALLNTSFNLHGYPIVGTPRRAVETVLNSGLKYLSIGSIILEKKCG